MSDEAEKLFLELAVAADELLNEQREEPLSQVSEEVREFVREELVWIAEKLQRDYGYTPVQIRQLIREILTVSI